MHASIKQDDTKTLGHLRTWRSYLCPCGTRVGDVPCIYTNPRWKRINTRTALGYLHTWRVYLCSCGSRVGDVPCNHTNSTSSNQGWLCQYLNKLWPLGTCIPGVCTCALAVQNGLGMCPVLTNPKSHMGQAFTYRCLCRHSDVIHLELTSRLNNTPRRFFRLSYQMASSIGPTAQELAQLIDAQSLATWCGFDATTPPPPAATTGPRNILCLCCMRASRVARDQIKNPGTNEPRTKEPRNQGTKKRFV